MTRTTKHFWSAFCVGSETPVSLGLVLRLVVLVFAAAAVLYNANYRLDRMEATMISQYDEVRRLITQKTMLRWTSLDDRTYMEHYALLNGHKLPSHDSVTDWTKILNGNDKGEPQ